MRASIFTCDASEPPALAQLLGSRRRRVRISTVAAALTRPRLPCARTAETPLSLAVRPGGGEAMPWSGAHRLATCAFLRLRASRGSESQRGDRPGPFESCQQAQAGGLSPGPRLITASEPAAGRYGAHAVRFGGPVGVAESPAGVAARVGAVVIVRLSNRTKRNSNSCGKSEVATVTVTAT